MCYEPKYETPSINTVGIAKNETGTIRATGKPLTKRSVKSAAKPRVKRTLVIA